MNGSGRGRLAAALRAEKLAGRVFRAPANSPGAVLAASPNRRAGSPNRLADKNVCPTTYCLALAAALWLLCGPALAQQQRIPSLAYEAAHGVLQQGDVRDALSSYQDALRGAVKTAQARWIDSICYFTMIGECQYQLGQLDAALDNFTSALDLYTQYSNWLVSVQFSDPRPRRTVVAAPWGQSTRGAAVATYDKSYLIARGRLDNQNVVRQGGVIQAPQLTPVDAIEIVRATAHAMRRRRELMGPTCAASPLSKNLVAKFSGRPGVPNHWSQAFIDVQLGIALAAAGNAPQALSTLEHGLLAGGQFDHPLTGLALLEMGKLAVEAGDLPAAARALFEASLAAAAFDDWFVVEEALRWGQAVHLASNAQGMYPPLPIALEWARKQGLRQLHASLAALTAENLVVLGDGKAAAARIADARSSIGRRDLAHGGLGARVQHISALVAYQSGNVKAGDEALAAALAYQAKSSLWLFHLVMAERLIGSRTLSERQAGQLYDVLLRDPSSIDWIGNPLEALGVLSTPHADAFDRWLEITWKKEKEVDQQKALEIADRARRHRFFSSLPLGGRLLSLRWLLEAPEEQLSDIARLQRADLLARFPDYEQLAKRSRDLVAELSKRPLVEDDPAARKDLIRQYDALAETSQAQEVWLRQLAVRREPGELVFPPLRSAKELRAALPAGQVVLAFHAGDHALYGFLFDRERFRSWRVANVSGLQKKLPQLLKELGSVDANHGLAAQDFAQQKWPKTAAEIVELLLAGSSAELAGQYDELVVVPDGILWYLPFELLPSAKAADSPPLIAHARLRYVPTIGLAASWGAPEPPQPRTGVILGKIFPQDHEDLSSAAFERLARTLPDTVAWPTPSPAPARLLRGRFDRLVVLDEIEPASHPFDWSPAPTDRHKAAGSLETWLSLPWGGPACVVLPGFRSAAENGLKKAHASGNELFLAVCGLMATGARTVLISRWRMGGQTSYDLVSEFVQELPHTAPADAWQRSVQLAIDAPLDFDLEPRVKKFRPKEKLPDKKHPLFWAGYLLADTGGSRADPGTPPAKPPAPAVARQAEPAPRQAMPARDDHPPAPRDADEMADDADDTAGAESTTDADDAPAADPTADKPQEPAE